MQTTLTTSEIQERWSKAKGKWENKTLESHHFENFILYLITSEKGQEDFQKQIDSLFNKYGAKMSLPLITNLALWIKFKQNGN